MEVHLYGVMWSSAVVPDGIDGRGGTSPRLVVDDDLAALVGDVDSDVAPRRQDLLAHAHVLEACAEAETVIPARFGIVLDDDDNVCRRVLNGQRDVLRHLLRTFEGLQQVTVRVSVPEELALREVLARRPDVREARERMTASGRSVAATDELVELGREVSLEVAEIREQQRHAVLERLAPLARAVAENEATGEWEAVNAAFLVDRRTRDKFDLAVSLIEQQGSSQVRYVGPQPPYSFLEPAQAGELAWA
ncbi:GvpL/GvpF family gas vesicle protein [Intrasporangium mesophilum]